MTPGRGFAVHGALLAVAAACSVYVWTREKQPKALAVTDVVVWSGRSEDVERVAYEGKNKKATLEAKRDAAGRYFVGTFEKESPAPAGADGGAPAAEPKKTSATFVSVGAAGKLADALSPLKAFRSVGKIGDDRAAEFGLAEPEGTLTVVLRGAERKLVIGGPTPGGADRYAKDAATGEVFAIKGDVYRDLDQAEARLTERDLHEWKDADVASARVVAGDKSREVVRGGTEGKRFWADAGAPETNDETVGNWMSKLERLRPSEYLLAPPEGAATVVRVEYKGSSAQLGFVEVVKGPAPKEGSGKPDFYVKSERTRHLAKVPTSVAEQVEQDLGSVVK